MGVDVLGDVLGIDVLKLDVMALPRFLLPICSKT